MKRLIVSGAVLLGCFSSIVTGCGSRSSDTDYLPGAIAGESGLGASAGLANSGGAVAVGGASAGGTSAAGASGSVNAAGASGSGGGSHFAGAGGAIGTAGGPVAAGGASGASFGGSAGTAAGGTSSGGAATGGSSTGGAAMGGTTSTGGSSGASGAGGLAGAGGGNSASCPVALPNNNSMCSTAALQCNYTGRSCDCRALGNNLIWRCTGSGNACPGTEPTAATACMGTLQCPYPSGQQCNCGASGQWNCFTAGCPASKPTPSGSCGSVFGQCTYGTGAGSACVCVAGGWFCN